MYDVHVASPAAKFAVCDEPARVWVVVRGWDCIRMHLSAYEQFRISIGFWLKG